MDIFDVFSKDNLKDKLTLILIYDRIWKKQCFVFEIYKNGSLACSLKSIQKDYFVHNKTKKYGSNFFRSLRDMDESELPLTADKIIEGIVQLSTNIDNNVEAETLAQYCKRTKDERKINKIICEYLKVEDSDFYKSNQVIKINVLEKYKIGPNHFRQLCSILCVDKHTKSPKKKRKSDGERWSIVF